MQGPKTYKVLVVEDEGLIAHDIAQRLSALGHSVVATVSTAEEAIAQAAGADVVLMDIRIDGERDGIEAATEIRTRHHVPVVFLTAHADRSTLDRAKLAGPFGYVVKPLGPASLNTAIEIAIYKHQMERQLEEREAWLRTTLASAGEAILVAGPSGNILMLNREAEVLTGWKQAEAEGKPWMEVVRLTDAESGQDSGDLAALATLRGEPIPLGRELRLILREGRQTPVEGSVAPVRTSAGPAGVVITLRDVGARLWAERQLRQSQRMEAAWRLAASVSNDYSNLIGIIRNQAGQLLAQFGEYSPARRALEEIHQAATAADQITRRLAGFGTRQAVHSEVLSLNGILRRMSKLIESVAGRGITVAIQPQAGAGHIRADAGQLEQTIMNLVLHACSLLPEGGTLSIATAQADAKGWAPGSHPANATVSLTIRYSAAEPDVEHLFEPAASGDAGLTLAVAHSSIAEMGGCVTARALAEGTTEIEVLLPAIEEQLPAAAAAGAGAAPTILLIESRERVRAHLHNVLEAAGYNVLEAADQEEAIALGEVHDGGLDLLIADAGAAAIKEGLRARHPALQVLRIVDGPETAADEIQQPFTQQELVARLASLLPRQAETVAATSS
jgi:PAS domain S-box-containing protein